MAGRISRYLGIDYGKSKVGLSLAENETKISFAYGTLENNKDFFSCLMEIIKKEKIDKVIVNDYCLIFKELIILKDGRVLIKAKSEKEAKEAYEFAKSILGFIQDKT